MWSPQMLEHSRIITTFRESYAGERDFIQVLSTPFGQH